MIGSLLAIMGGVVDETVWRVEVEEEAFALRRIADFWQEGEYQLAKGQIEEFLALHQESTCAPALFTALGDLYLQEKNYSEALQCYSRVQSDDGPLLSVNRMHCLYHLRWYATLADECEQFLQNSVHTAPEERLEATYFLAIALFEQCLQKEEDAEKLATRAEPYFESLFASDLSEEVAQAFAHLSCILKKYERASQIYLTLAERDSASEEEMLFRAAELQLEYDQELALATFTDILRRSDLSDEVRKRALFHQMALLFQTGHYETLVADRDRFVDLVEAPLYLGRSELALGHFEDAVVELQQAVISEETSQGVLLSLLDAASAAGDLQVFSEAFAQFMHRFPQDPKLSAIRFAKALLLKRLQKTADAKEELEALLNDESELPEREQVAFERLHLSLQEGSWEECRVRAIQFLDMFPTSPLAVYAWRYRVSSSMQMDSPETVASDLEQLVQDGHFSATAELQEWKLFLAKTYFDLGRKEDAALIVEALLAGELSPEGRANGYWLLALCRDSNRFVEYALNALQGPLTWVAPVDVDMALFNHALTEGHFEDAAHWLYTAFVAGAVLQTENLDWLISFFLERDAVEQATILLEMRTGDQEVPHEKILALARLYAQQHRWEAQAALLQRFKESVPFSAELQLYQGEMYAAQGHPEEALHVFDEILAEQPSLRSWVGANALFHKAILLKERDREAAAVAWKSLVLQKNLRHEPIYLEAAFEYIDLQADTVEKRLLLLTKWKADFSSEEDLLAKDYQAARKMLPKQDLIYQSYLRLAEAEIELCQAQLSQDESLYQQAKQRLETLLQEGVLTARVTRCLNGLHGSL